MVMIIEVLVLDASLDWPLDAYLDQYMCVASGNWFCLVVYSHSLGPEQEPRRICCIVLRRAFHTAT